MILTYPIRMYVEITNQCNFACIHCYLGDQRTESHMSFDLFSKVVREMEEMGVFEVILGGGEPLMHPSLHAMLEYLSTLRLSCAVTTNGYFVDTPFIDVLESIKFRGSIQVSIHGRYPETHNKIVNHPLGYHRAMEALQQLLSHRIAVTVAVTATTLNYKEIPALLEDMEGRGVTSFNIIFVVPVGRATDSLVLKPHEEREILEYIQKTKSRCTIFTDYNLSFEWLTSVRKNPLFQYYCSCGVAHAALDPEGNVFPCSLLKFPEFRLGNCATTHLKKIFTHPETTIMKELYGTSPSECKGCTYEYVCKGGCRAVAYVHEGTPLARDTRCPKKVGL